MTTDLREMEQISNEEWQIEKTMTTGSIFCSIAFFIFSLLRLILVFAASTVESGNFLTGLSLNENMLLTKLIRNISFILAAFNMPIILLLLIIQNSGFRGQLKYQYHSLRLLCQMQCRENTQPKNKAPEGQSKGNL